MTTPELAAFHPLGQFVLVRRDDIEVMPSGIILDAKAIRRNFYVRGVVCKLGPGKLLVDPDTGATQRRPTGVEVGEHVWFWLDANVGHRVIVLDGVEYGVVAEDAIDMAGDASVRVQAQGLPGRGGQ